jgi:hypothetical protein
MGHIKGVLSKNKEKENPVDGIEQQRKLKMHNICFNNA